MPCATLATGKQCFQRIQSTPSAKWRARIHVNSVTVFRNVIAHSLGLRWGEIPFDYCGRTELCAVRVRYNCSFENVAPMACRPAFHYNVPVFSMGNVMDFNYQTADSNHLYHQEGNIRGTILHPTFFVSLWGYIFFIQIFLIQIIAVMLCSNHFCCQLPFLNR